MKPLIALLVLFTLVSRTAFAQQERLVHLAEPLKLSTGQ